MCLRELDHKEGWVLKNWCLWRKLLRVPWAARRSNQSILNNPEYSLEGVMLKLKLQYFGHLMRMADSLEKTLMLGKIEGRRRRGWQRMGWLDGNIKSMDMNLSKLREIVKDREASCAAVHGVTESDMTLNNNKRRPDWVPGITYPIYPTIQHLVHYSPSPLYWKDWCWSWNSNTLATWHEELTHLKRPWC